MKIFGFSTIFSAICLILGWIWGGWMALYILFILAILEISLSFDNAVVNARVLRTMSHFWQQLFLTVGILIAVFGMRLVFPIAIVAFAIGRDWSYVVDLALNDPELYSQYLQASHVTIASFGGMFLLMVSLYFLFDEEKEIHWLKWIEAPLARMGKVTAIQVMIAMSILLVISRFLPQDVRLSALFAGMIGILLYVVINGLDSFISVLTGKDINSTGAAARSGFVAFLYLEVLDASFSLDGVIGAFALTRDVVVIMLGLAIGAVFVRSITIMLVRKGTLSEFIYLEHGAHYAIAALGVTLLLSALWHVPEWITGSGGVILIMLAFLSSLHHRKRNQTKS